MQNIDNTQPHIEPDEKIISSPDPWGIVADSPEEKKELRSLADLLIIMQARIIFFPEINISSQQIEDIRAGKIDKFTLEELSRLEQESR